MANLFCDDIFKDQYMDPPYNNNNLTNRVLVKYEKAQKKIQYFCPAYLRGKIRNFDDLNLSDLVASINLVFKLTINFNGIPKFIQNQIIKKAVLRFNRDEPLNIGQTQSTKYTTFSRKDDGIVDFTIRKYLKAGLKAHINWTPFQMIYLILTIKVQKIHIDKTDINLIVHQKKKLVRQKRQDIKSPNSNNTQQENLQIQEENKSIQKQIDKLQDQIKQISKYKHITIFINLMDLHGENNKPYKLYYTQKGTFGDYELAESLLEVQYTNLDLAPRIRKQRQEKRNIIKTTQNYSKISPFEFAHFQIPLFKFPTVTLLTIFIPLWLLGILNLGVFFQDQSFSDRIGSLSALMIAFTALIPVIRQALPPNPKITLVQVLVYLQTSTTMLCFVESMYHRGQQDYVFVWSQNPFFLASMIIGLFQCLLIAVFLILYIFCWKNQYNLNVHDLDDENFDFNYRDWYNQQCDKHFRRKLDSQQIKILKLEQNTLLKEKNQRQQIVI